MTLDGTRRERRDAGQDAGQDARKQYHAHGRELWARFYVLCCDRDLAWEALQQAFLKLLQQGDAAIQNPRAWLLRVGSNWLADAARTHSRRPTLSGDVDHLVGPTPEPATELLSGEQRDEVRRALSRLNTEERRVLVLRYALDWDTERIADSLGVRPSAVHMRLSRARRHLRLLLKVDEHGKE